jgi:hypothetical protein
MHTHGADSGNGMSAATKDIADHGVALARLELKLAALEVKAKASALGMGVGLLMGTAVFGLFALGFALAATAAALAIALPTWLAVLVVAAGLFLVAAILGSAGLAVVKRGAPPIPEQAIEEARLTTKAVKSNGHRRSTT